MLGINIGHDNNRRTEQEKRPITLVGFGNQKTPLSQPGIGPQHVEPSTNNHGWIKVGMGQGGGDQGGRRCLAMRPGNRDAVFEAHQLGQHFSPGNDRNMECPRPHDFRIRIFDRRRDDHNIVSAWTCRGWCP